MRTTICFALLAAVTLFTVADARALLSARDYGDSEAFESFPSLETTERTASGKKAIIEFTAFESRITVFVNGKPEATIHSSTKQIATRLKKDDVVAFEGEKLGNPKKVGLLATIKIGKQIHRTGVERFTTKVDLPQWKKWEKREWKKVKMYKDAETGERLRFCHWKKARKVRIKKKFDDKAFYIWNLEGALKKPARHVLIRFVLGDEKCNGKGNKKDDEDDEDDEDDDDGKKGVDGDDGKQEDDEDDGEQGDDKDGGDGKSRVPVAREDISGQSDEQNDGFCACRYTDVKGGQCYDMEDVAASSGKCKPRACEPKFECVAAGDKMCVKRRGRKKVMMTSPNVCEVVDADDVEVLLPYEG